MKPLKTLWNVTGKPTTFFTAMAACLAVLSYSWYRLGQRYDLQAVAETESYRLGVLSVLSGTVIAVSAGGALVTLVNHYRPRPQPQPLSVDPDFPPTRMIYLQGEGTAERCACHDEVIKDGTEIWHWPQPAKLVCIKEGDGE